MEIEKALHIDIEKIIKEKNPALYRWMPQFLLNYIKRTIHQDEINYVLETYNDKKGLDFVKAVIQYFNLEIIVKGAENIPAEGKYIFAANHPLGGLEAMALIKTVSEIHPEVRFVVNDILMNLKNYEPIFIPVNKHGKYSRNYAEILDTAFNSNAQMLYFPAGLVSRKIKGKITDLEWKKSFVAKSVQYERDIVPVFIDGKNSNFFYNLANFRKAIGIRANIEMFYLPDEMFRQKNKSLTLYFGKPISYSTFQNNKSHSEWANEIKQMVYNIKNTMK